MKFKMKHFENKKKKIYKFVNIPFSFIHTNQKSKDGHITLGNG